MELFRIRDEVNVLQRSSEHLKTFAGGSIWFTKMSNSTSSYILALEDFGGQIPLILTLNTQLICEIKSIILLWHGNNLLIDEVGSIHWLKRQSRTTKLLT